MERNAKLIACETCEVVWGSSWITGALVFWAKAIGPSGLYIAGETKPLSVYLSEVSGFVLDTRKNRRLFKQLNEVLSTQGWENTGKVGTEFWRYAFRREVTGSREEPVTVVLKEVGLRKVDVLKVVRFFSGLRLKEAYNLVQQAPKPVIANVTRDTAMTIAKWFTEAGATVDVI